MARIDLEPTPYFSVSTISVTPGKMEQALASLAEVAEATMLNEPGAKIYRYYKSEKEDEIVCMEKFESREAYAIHTSSQHVRDWANKYLNSGLFTGSFEFHHLNKDGVQPGGFDRP